MEIRKRQFPDSQETRRALPEFRKIREFWKRAVCLPKTWNLPDIEESRRVFPGD